MSPSEEIKKRWELLRRDRAESPEMLAVEAPKAEKTAALETSAHEKTAFWYGFEKRAKELTTKTRKNLPDDAFVFPKERKFPIHDEAHARNALARAHFASNPAKVRAAVHAKYPNIGKE